MFLNIENNCQFSGRLVRDPLVYEKDGKVSVVKITIANNNNYINANGDKVESSTFFECVIFGKAASYWAARVEKGDYVTIQAEFANTTYEKDGKTLYGYQFKVNSMKNWAFLTGKTKTRQENAQEDSHFGNDNSDLPFKENEAFQDELDDLY